MIDMKLVRECPAVVREALAKRHTAAPVDEILSLDEKRRTLLSETETLRARRNVVSKQISRMKDDGERQALIDEMRKVGTRIKALDAELHVVQSDLNAALLQVPNMPHPDTPVGTDENENVVVRSEGTLVARAHLGNSISNLWPTGTLALRWGLLISSEGSSFPALASTS